MKKISISVLLSLLLIFSFSSNTFAATIGQSLTSPEEGWKRYDGSDKAIEYIGSGWTTQRNSSYYQGSMHYTQTINGTKVKFGFVGSKIRYIGVGYPTHSTQLLITIDGVRESFSQRTSSAIYQHLEYEKTNLDFGYHTVEIVSTNSYGPRLDAIDIDNTGYLVNPNAPLNLNATAGDSQVTLSWNQVDSAERYILHYGTESGNYTKTVTVTEDTYGIIPALTNGKTYYFVVTSVIDGVESGYSNEVQSTPQGKATEPEEPTTPSGNRAILVVTMLNGLEKEYDLSLDEVNGFLDWYDAKDAGIGPAKYAIDKHSNNKGPFSKRTDYVIFNNILTFEVNEYNTAPSETK
ncbi:fibronectin type III domain-containing protein [Paenibacillus sp. TH7-28]